MQRHLAVNRSMCVSRQFFFFISNYWPNTGSIWFISMAKRCLDGVATNWRDYLDYRFTDIRMYVVCVWMEDERTAAHGVDDADEWHLFSIQAFCVVCATEANATRHGFVRYSITIERFAISFIELICQKFVFSFDPGSIWLLTLISILSCCAGPCHAVSCQ